jgi:multicomponent Na+:H+ antiporter subunit A
MDLPITILACFALALVAPQLAPRLGRATGYGMALLPAGITAYFSTYVGHVDAERVIIARYAWAETLNLSWSFYLDGLALLFVLMISGIGTLIGVYAGAYLAGHRLLGVFYAYLFLFMGSMLGVVVAGNLLTIYVFWELTTISSFLLIGFQHEQEASRSAAVQALLTTVLGGLAILAGFVMLGTIGGSYEIRELLERGDQVREHAWYKACLLLIVMGAFTKSAQFPFHYWLPSAMEAPTPVSAYLHSATMVKAGIYLLARLSPVLGDTTWWLAIVTGIGALTMLSGAWLAFWERDLKSILAYLTINVLGTLVMLLGIGTELAVKAAMTYLVAHALYKGALFLVVGAVDHETHTRNLDELGGLWRRMPLSTATAILAALSMAGILPLYGFIAKELYLETVWKSPHASEWLTGVSVAASLLLVAGAGLVGFWPYFGKLTDKTKDAHEASSSFWIPAMILAASGLACGLSPQWLTGSLLEPAVASVRQSSTELHLKLWHGVTPPFLLSLVALAGGAVLLAMRPLLLRGLTWHQRITSYGPSAWYEATMWLLRQTADWQTRTLQSGYLGWYMATILLALITLVTWMLTRNPWDWWGVWETEVRFYEALALLLIVAGTITAVVSPSRLRSVAALSVVGLNIAWLFNLFGAPDLAMTQIVVESLTVFLFVMAFHHLPGFTLLSTRRARARDAIVAIATGAITTLLLLVVTGDPPTDPSSNYYAEHAYHLAHGKNVVNVILVDFRAFDTLGEITVLAISGTGVYTLLRFTKGALTS